MSSQNNKPVFFLAFANDRADGVKYLRDLPEELRLLREALERAKAQGLCEYVERANATIADILDVFQNPIYRDRIAVFHFGGHANSYNLLLESSKGEARAADAGGLAAFFGQQRGLQLVFLNGCSTEKQVQGLLEAGVSAVIATSQAIEDRTAMIFASRFYTGLAGGTSINRAYKEAEAGLRIDRGDSFRNLYYPGPQRDRWPWSLYVKDGAEEVGLWNLPQAVRNPLFGLPHIPRGDLPESPFRHLNWFTKEDSEIFFGRNQEIRKLYDLISPDTPPIILLYGQSGVGRSSILSAGLLPRLGAGQEVHYLRRDQSVGLTETLKRAPILDGCETGLSLAWVEAEARLRKPVLIVLDQVEEVFTRPNAELPGELEDFANCLKEAFAVPAARPGGKLILVFRKEWLPEVEQRLKDAKLARAKVFLDRLSRDGIIEAITGTARSSRLQTHYGLTVEEGLAEIIADNLLEDPGSPIAPTLQILLTKMWAEAKRVDQGRPVFGRNLYQGLKSKGILLKDFLDQQIAKLRDAQPEVVNSGLAIDVLAFHTTPLGTAEQRKAEELDCEYAHQKKDVLPLLIQQCKDLYLLADSSQDKAVGTADESTRLAHDTLAPLVRLEFDKSVMPGQRARRILENRSVEWRDEKKGTSLDDPDLMAVERGASGMRVRRPEEELLVKASQNERNQKKRRSKILRAAGVIAVLAIAASAGIAWYQKNEAERLLYLSSAQSLREQVAQGVSTDRKDLTELLTLQSYLFLKRIHEEIPFQTEELIRSIASDSIKKSGCYSVISRDGKRMAESMSYGGTVTVFDTQERIALNLSGHPVGHISAAIKPDGSMIGTVGEDNKVRLWDWNRIAAIAATTESEGIKYIDVVSPDRVLKKPVEKISIKMIEFVSDHELAGIVDNNAPVILWDLRQPESEPVILGQSLRGELDMAGIAECISIVKRFESDCSAMPKFSPDGQTLALRRSKSSTFKLYNWRDLPFASVPLNLTPYFSKVQALEFSPDGKLLALSTADDTAPPLLQAEVWLLDLEHHGKVIELSYGGIADGTDPINSLAFNEKGTLLVGGSLAGKIWLWDLRQKSPAPYFVGTQSPKRPFSKIISVAFGPDDETVTAVNNFEEVRTWYISLDAAANAVCGKIWRNLSASEWFSVHRPRHSVRAHLPKFTSRRRPAAALEIFQYAPDLGYC